VGEFNDAFVISLDDVVVSLLPDCSNIVAVNSANGGNPQVDPPLPPVNEHLFLDNDDDITPTVAPENLPILVEYDGMTIRLRVCAFVTPNQLHAVRIAIADVDGQGMSDDRLDSGLFIGNSSVRTIAPTS